jgi:hypothetical protein
MCLHLAMTLWLDDESTGLPHQRQPHLQGSWLWPDRQAGAHCCRLLMTSWTSIGKDTGIVTSMWVYTHWLGLWRVSSFKKMFKSACPTQGPVTINLNCKFFAMVSSQDTYQLLIVSHVLSSGQYPIQKVTKIYKESYWSIQESYRTGKFELECSMSALVRSSVHWNGIYPTLKTFLRFFIYRSFEGVEAQEGCKNVA